MPNVTKKNLIIVWKRNHLFTKNYFRKKKINYCYWFMPGDLQVICGSMVGKNRQSPDSTETPAYKETFFLSAVKILRYRALIFVAYAELLALLHFCTPPPYCYWWLIMKKRSCKLYRIPNPNPTGARKCNSAELFISTWNWINVNVDEFRCFPISLTC